MKARSKKDGKIFTGKVAELAIKAGFGEPVEEETPPVEKTVKKKPVKKAAPKKAVKKAVKKTTK